MLQVITGKPGAGKTYHAVNYLILPKLVDWCKYEERKNVPFPRKLYTNLPLDLDYIDKELCKRYKLRVKPSSYINLVELKGEFWKKCPDGSLLAFDEVHLALGSEIEGANALSTEWRNYVSTHRHHQHDIILLTQHIDNVSKDVLRQCEEIIDLQNIKSGRIPYLSIPLSDVFLVLKSFGYEQQTYRASYGRVIGKAIKYNGTNETFFINKSDFGFYNTHSHGSQSAYDSPDLNLGKLASLFWFIKKHLLKVFVRIAFVVLAIYLIISFIRGLPETLSKNASFKSSSKSSVSIPAKVQDTSNSQKFSKAFKTSDYIKTPDSSEKIPIPTAPLIEKKQFHLLGIIKNCVLFSDGSKGRIGDKIEGFDASIIEINASDGFVIFDNNKTLYLK